MNLFILKVTLLFKLYGVYYEEEPQEVLLNMLQKNKIRGVIDHLDSLNELYCHIEFDRSSEMNT